MAQILYLWPECPGVLYSRPIPEGVRLSALPNALTFLAHPQPRRGATVRPDGTARGEPSLLGLSRVVTEEGKAKPHLKTKPRQWLSWKEGYSHLYVVKPQRGDTRPRCHASHSLLLCLIVTRALRHTIPLFPYLIPKRPQRGQKRIAQGRAK